MAQTITEILNNFATKLDVAIVESIEKGSTPPEKLLMLRSYLYQRSKEIPDTNPPEEPTGNFENLVNIAESQNNNLIDIKSKLDTLINLLTLTLITQETDNQILDTDLQNDNNELLLGII